MTRLVLFGAVVGMAIAATGAVAYASDGSSGSAATQWVAPTHSSKPAVAPHAVPLDTATELKYTAVAPCRAVDTRIAGGQMSNGTLRNFLIGGTSSFTGQGGPSTGCGVPAQASAVTATITVLGTGKGYVKAWAYGASQPATSFMNYTNVFNAATGGTIPLGAGRASVENFVSKAQVIVDVTGYYIKPLSAYVGSTGALVRGSRATASSQPFGVGTYEVDFDRDVSACVYSVTYYASGYTVEAQPRASNVNGVFVYIGSVGSTPTASNAAFYLVVTC